MSVIQNAVCKLVNINTNCQYLWARRFNVSILNLSKRTSIEEKLGIQRRPKRPLTAFLQYVSERRPIVVQQNPNKKQAELLKIMSEEWRQLDQTKKDDLQGKFKKDWIKYQENCKKYDATLSPGEKEQIKIVKEEAKILQAKKFLKKRRAELGCPKKPGSSYMYFMRTRLPERGDEPFNDFQRKVQKDWEVLPSSEKIRFEEMYKKDLEDYRQKKAQWNKEMLEKGNKEVDIKISSSNPKSESGVLSSTLSASDVPKLNRDEKYIVNNMNSSNSNTSYVNKQIIFVLLISSCVAILSFMFVFIF